MNKKLMAVAVAGVFAAPVAAFAQSSVTISGQLKGGFESLSYGSSNAARVGNHSTTGVADDSSALVFTILEDLGGGLQAEGRLDLRMSVDSGGQSANTAGNAAIGNTAGLASASGNSHLGLKSKQWGTVFFGRQDLHYFNNESNLTDKGSLRATSVALLSYVINPAGRSAPIANATRTGNVVYYKTPDFGPFWMIVAYSSNAAGAGGQETDIGATGRKGWAWNLNPNLSGANWQVGYSYWKSKQDSGQAGNASLTGDQRGDRLYGSYVWSGFKIGLAYDHSKVTGAFNGVVQNKRDVWSIPASYTWGPHTIQGHYTWAQKDKAAQFNGLDTKANMWALSYAYELSKRTSAAFTYAKVNNHSAANYNVFASTSLGLDNGTAGAATGAMAGEDPSIWAVTLRHAF